MDKHVWVSVDEGLLDEGFDCPLFRPHPDGLRYNGGSVTADDERSKK
jgi:hypothetical protein